MPYASSCIAARAACERHSSSSIKVAVGHVKDPFTFTYVNFLYAFSPSPPYALLGWVPLDLGARVTMGMCVSLVLLQLRAALPLQSRSQSVTHVRCLQPLDDGRSLLLSYGHSDTSMRVAVYDTGAALHLMTLV